MINKQQTLPNLEKFCKEMHEKHEIRFQPHNPPVDYILDMLMGRSEALLEILSILNTRVDALVEESIKRNTEQNQVTEKKSRKKVVKNEQ